MCRDPCRRKIDDVTLIVREDNCQLEYCLTCTTKEKFSILCNQKNIKKTVLSEQKIIITCQMSVEESSDKLESYYSNRSTDLFEEFLQPSYYKHIKHYSNTFSRIKKNACVFLTFKNSVVLLFSFNCVYTYKPTNQEHKSIQSKFIVLFPLSFC